jgi:metallo-beta-lactamase family protein
MTRAQHTLRFLGGAGTVTGSKFLVETGPSRVLVDAGLFQGYKQLRLRNRDAFPVPPDSLDALMLTHAHIDHTGYVPALIRDGYDGPVLATSGTADLLRLLWPDSAHLMEEEAEYAARKGFSKHAKPEPLYTAADAEQALSRIRLVERDCDYDVAPGVSARWHPAGHIVGASSVQLTTGAGTVFFSGDLGQDDDALMREPRPFPGSDILLMESTYGDELHGDFSPLDQLEEAMAPVLERRGVVLIPAFAVGRTQALMLHISRLMHQKRIPEVPVFVNSPMAVNASGIYAQHSDELRVDHDELERMYASVKMVRTVDQSIALNMADGPMIIISASGMMTGGRVLHHVVAFGQDPNNAIILSGFQAGGTRGADLARGERTLRIFGEDIPIKAQITQIDSMSAHADADQLLAWVRSAPTPPRMTYLVHGEHHAADRMRFRIEHELGWPVRVAEHNEEIDLENPR